MSVPKLSFRAKPLKLPLLKHPTTLTPPPKKEHVVLEVKSDSNEPPKRGYWRYFPLVFLCMFALRMFIHTSIPAHTIRELRCHRDRHTVRCTSRQRGTFVVNVPEACESVYDIGGVPFSAAGSSGMFRVPTKELVVKDVIGKCNIQAYMDSKVTKLSVPFTWVTTKQHTRFTITVNDDMIVEKAVAFMFDSTRRGNWIAYTYDVSVPVKTVSVVGDGTDVIHIYPPREI